MPRSPDAAPTLGAAASAPAPLPDFRCPMCQALLFRGQLVGEIVCRKCGRLNTCTGAALKSPVEVRR